MRCSRRDLESHQGVYPGTCATVACHRAGRIICASVAGPPHPTIYIDRLQPAYSQNPMHLESGSETLLFAGVTGHRRLQLAVGHGRCRSGLSDNLRGRRSAGLDTSNWRLV